MVAAVVEANAEDYVANAIPIRDVRFDFTSDVPSHWCVGRPEFSQVANAFMQTLPYLEPYFVYNIRQAGERITDPQLRAEVAAYVGQEARHAQEHKRFNLRLRESYPGLLPLERRAHERLASSRQQDSLAFRVAYTAGFEAITYRMACFLLEKSDHWLASADSRVLGMLVWHMVEEVEHKNVAFDVLQCIDPRLSLRLHGLYAATCAAVKDIAAMARHMLEVDGLWRDPASRRRLRRVMLELLGEFVPGYCSYFMPGHHPRLHRDPALVGAWRAYHAAGADVRVLSWSQLG